MTVAFRRDRRTAERILDAATSLPLPPEAVFEFFSDAGNLERITPPEVGFEILTPKPISMGRGTLIDYRIRLGRWPMRWRTRISEWDPPSVFTDEQLRGPYAQWIHRHEFRPTPDGTEVFDEVRYRLPLEPFAGLVHALFVRRQLARIFAYRAESIRRILLPRSSRSLPPSASIRPSPAAPESKPEGGVAS